MSQKEQFEKDIEFQDSAIARDLFGAHEKNLETLSEKTGVQVTARGTNVLLRSENKQDLDLASKCLFQLYDLLRSGHSLHAQDMEYALRILSNNPETDLKSFFKNNVYVVSPKKTITPKTLTQRAYLSAIREKDMIFAIGPAGTGKTYLSVAMAVLYLLQRKVKRIILARPAVEAGEKLGFLPGDMREKVNPYLRPLYDALHDMLDLQKVQEMIESGLIEIAPLAFMRGRNLNDSFIILDEAQNTTPEQMKMFLTRMGFGSKVIVTGDVTQVDLPGRAESGLIQAQGVLKDIEGIDFVHFHEGDVIRHPLVGKIVKAYDIHQQKK
jgi:phosphate starvation-inducible PhoH-like protein